MTLTQERHEWEQESLETPLPKGISCKNEVISGVDCVWVKAANSRCDSAIIYMHGGGLVAGSAVTHRQFAASLSGACAQPVLLINYRLLPEHTYPAPLDDVLLVYNALLSTKRYSSDQLVFGGDSSGATLVLAALVKFRDAGVPMPNCAFTVSGAFDMTLTSESMQSNSCTDPHLSKAALKKWQKDYLHYDLKSPDLSPYYANLADLPPLMLLVGGQEPWRCDSHNVAYKIKQSSGTVTLREWSEMEHVWIMDFSLHESEEALQEIAEFLLQVRLI